MSETFTPRCSFGTARRFRISPASYVDLTQTFSRRGFPSLPCLRRCVKYLTNVQSPKEKVRELKISSQFDAIFSTATHAFVCKVRLSIDKRGSFSLIPIGARPFPKLTLLTYISMTKCLQRYRAVDTKMLFPNDTHFPSTLLACLPWSFASSVCSVRHATFR